MKTILRTLFFLLGCVAIQVPSHAAEKDAVAGNAPPHPVMPAAGGGADMKNGSDVSDAIIDKNVRRMQEFMIENHEFMHKIRDAKTEKEKAQLKDEWLVAMKHQHHSHPNEVPKQLMMHGAPTPNTPSK